MIKDICEAAFECGRGSFVEKKKGVDSRYSTSSRLELVEQFALISEQCAHRKLYPTMRTLYPRLFWCRLRVRGVNNSFRCSPHACPYYRAIISKGPKLNPAFQPPFSLSPLIFLRIFVFLPLGKKTLEKTKERKKGSRDIRPDMHHLCVSFFLSSYLDSARETNGRRKVIVVIKFDRVYRVA